MTAVFGVIAYVSLVVFLMSIAINRREHRRLKTTEARMVQALRDFEHPEPPARVKTELEGLAAAYLEDPDPAAEGRGKATADALRKVFGVPDIVLATVLLMVWQMGSTLMDDSDEHQFGDFLEALGLAAVDLSALERELAE